MFSGGRRPILGCERDMILDPQRHRRRQVATITSREAASGAGRWLRQRKEHRDGQPACSSAPAAKGTEGGLRWPHRRGSEEGVRRLERVDVSQNREAVVQYRARALRASPSIPPMSSARGGRRRSPSTRLRDEASHTMGLVVDAILDIVEGVSSGRGGDRRRGYLAARHRREAPDVIEPDTY